MTARRTRIILCLALLFGVCQPHFTIAQNQSESSSPAFSSKSPQLSIKFEDDFSSADSSVRTTDASRGQWTFRNNIASATCDPELFAKYKNHGPVIRWEAAFSQADIEFEMKSSDSQRVTFTLNGDGHVFRITLTDRTPTAKPKPSPLETKIIAWATKSSKKNQGDVFQPDGMPDLASLKDRWVKVSLKIRGERVVVAIDDFKTSLAHQALLRDKNLIGLTFAHGKLAIRNFKLNATPNPDAAGDAANNSGVKRPNIVLLLVDDLGWNDLGYRNPNFETPNIDRLVSESLDFQRAYVASPTCSPSRATLLTGKHPARLRMVRHIPTGTKNATYGFDEMGRTKEPFNLLDADPAQFPSRNWLPLEHTTYAEALKSHGYYNQFVGKWHLGHEPYHPIHQGFDAQFGTTNFGHPKSYNAPFFRNTDVLSDVVDGHLTGVLTDESVRFIDQYDRDQPFMLSLWYYGVHRPPAGRPDLVKHFRDRGHSETLAIYAAQVKAVDESVGRIRKAIAQKGIAENTIIVFVSDQGSWYPNTPLRGTKRVDTLCEGGARVPFFFHWPGVVKPNRRCDSLVQTTDLFPTLVEIAGGKPDSHQDLDGVSLLTILEEKQQTVDRKTPLIGYRAYQDLYASVREDGWNMLAYRSGRTCLFNVKNDVSERQNVAAQHPKVMRELTAKLVAWEEEMGVLEYSGVKEIEPEFKHLFGAKLLLGKIQQVNPTPEQLDAFDRLGRGFKTDVMQLRKTAGITKAMIKIRDTAYRKLKQTDLKDDAFWLKLQEETGITDEQRDAFRKIKARANQFNADAREMLTPEQRNRLKSVPSRRQSDGDAS